MRAKLTLTYAFLFCQSGDEELVRERMCCAIALSLSHSFSQKHTEQVPVWRRDTHTKHENTKLTFEQKTKMASYVSYILVSNKREKKLCADWSITDKNHHTVSHSHSHSNTFTKIFTSITNPMLDFFFVVFLIFRQVQIFKFFIIHFSIALLFV